MIEMELAAIIGILLYGAENLRNLFQEHRRRIRQLIQRMRNNNAG